MFEALPGASDFLNKLLKLVLKQLFNIFGSKMITHSLYEKA